MEPRIEVLKPSTLLIVDSDGIKKLAAVLSQPPVIRHILPKELDPYSEKGQNALFTVEGGSYLDHAWIIINIKSGMKLSHFNYLERILTVFITSVDKDRCKRFIDEIHRKVTTVEKVYVISSDYIEESWDKPVTYITLGEMGEAVKESIIRETNRNKGTPAEYTETPEEDFERVRHIVYSEDEF